MVNVRKFTIHGSYGHTYHTFPFVFWDPWKRWEQRGMPPCPLGPLDKVQPAEPECHLSPILCEPSQLLRYGGNGGLDQSWKFTRRTNILLISTRTPVNSPVDMVNYSYIIPLFAGFGKHVRWFSRRISSIHQRRSTWKLKDYLQDNVTTFDINT